MKALTIIQNMMLHRHVSSSCLQADCKESNLNVLCWSDFFFFFFTKCRQFYSKMHKITLGMNGPITLAWSWGDESVRETVFFFSPYYYYSYSLCLVEKEFFSHVFLMSLKDKYTFRATGCTSLSNLTQAD